MDTSTYMRHRERTNPKVSYIRLAANDIPSLDRYGDATFSCPVGIRLIVFKNLDLTELSNDELTISQSTP